MLISFRTRTLYCVRFIHWTYTHTGAVGFTDDREDIFQEADTNPPYDVAGKDLTINFLHGRKTTEEEMGGWGFDGGMVNVIGPVISVDAAGIHFDNTHIPLVDGMAHVDDATATALGIQPGYYGDFEIEEKGA